MKRREQAGFTLIELVVTGGVLSILVVIAALLVHPVNYAPQERNAQRWLGVAQLAQGLARYVAANDGQLPTNLPTTATSIGLQNGEVDLCPTLVPKYAKDIPVDPLGGAAVMTTTCAGDYTSGFFVVKNKDGSVTFSAPAAELKAKIEFTRTY